MDIVYAEFAKRSGGKLSTYEVWSVADIKEGYMSTVITIASNAYDDSTVEAVESTATAIADSSEFLGLKASKFLPDRPTWTVLTTTENYNPNQNPSSSGGSSSNTVALAAGIGGGVGGAVLLAAIGTTVFCMKRKRSGVSMGREAASPAAYQGNDFAKPASVQSVSIAVDSSAYDEVQKPLPAQLASQPAAAVAPPPAVLARV
eukprot:tig00001041_g6558.t1